MKMGPCICSHAAWLLLAAGFCSSGAAESQTEPQEPWLKQRLEQFQDLKFGFMMHWGACSQRGCIESWPLVEEDKWARPDDLPAWTQRGKDFKRFQADYRALPKTFNPLKFDPRLWAKLAQPAGMKYVVFTQKGKTAYAICLAKDGNDGLPPRISFSSLQPAAGPKVRLLGVKQPLPWQTDTAGKTTIEVPASAQKSPPCRHAFVVKFQL
jgi:hypothetical protein